jgi:TonB family protein
MSSLLLLLLSFVQAGTVSGRLFQPDGKPAVGVRVSAVEASDRVSLMSVTQTDSTGSYKLENVPPGRYYIQAGTLGDPSYYPGTPDPDKATVVSVMGSAVLNSVDFSFAQWDNILKSTRAPVAGSEAEFSGKLRAASGVSFLQNVVVVLTNTQSAARFMTSTDKDGTFEFRNLPPSEYTVGFFSPANSGYNGNGYEEAQTSVVLHRSEALVEDIQLRLVMPAANARQRPDWYVPPPPRRASATLGPGAAIAARGIVDAAPPVYPEAARNANLKGAVAIRIHIGKDGELMWVRVQSAATEPILARAVLDAVNQWHFQPFRRNDEVLEGEMVFTFNFPPD